MFVLPAREGDMHVPRWRSKGYVVVLPVAQDRSSLFRGFAAVLRSMIAWLLSGSSPERNEHRSPEQFPVRESARTPVSRYRPKPY